MAYEINRYSAKRQGMIEKQLLTRGIKDPRVLAAFQETPRHLFVPEAFKNRAYFDRPLPIGVAQTISQPFMVALMTEKLDLNNRLQVLEIGTGSGYQTAILARLADRVYSVERIMSLAIQAREILESLKIRNILIKVSDGTLGWDEFAPYDRIIVTAGSPEIPRTLLKELKIGGKMIIPVGDNYAQKLLLVNKTSEEDFETEEICSCIFVPLIGKYGWEKSI